MDALVTMAYIIGFFGSIFVVFATPLLLPILIRSHRIRTLAKSYGFVYKSGFRFTFVQPDVQATNIIEATRDKSYRIADEIRDTGFFINDRLGRFGNRYTILTVDGVESTLKPGLMGYTSVSTISRTLEEISNGKEITTQETTAGASHASPFFYVWIFIMIVALILFIRK